MNPLTLKELQAEFAERLVLNSYSEKLATHISAEKHFIIYRHSMQGSLQKTLIEIYAVCYKLVGQDFFIAMANGYIEQHASTSPDLGDYGSQFPDWIENYKPAESVPYLADVARLEWAWQRLHHAIENAPFDFSQLTEENITFFLPHESTLLSSRYPIARIFEVNQEDFQEDTTVILTADTHYYYLVWRKNLTRRVDVLTEVEWQLLSRIKAGTTLEKISHQFQETLVTLLPRLVQQGWLNTISYTR